MRALFVSSWRLVFSFLVLCYLFCGLHWSTLRLYGCRRRSPHTESLLRTHFISSLVSHNCSFFIIFFLHDADSRARLNGPAAFGPVHPRVASHMLGYSMGRAIAVPGAVNPRNNQVEPPSPISFWSTACRITLIRKNELDCTFSNLLPIPSSFFIVVYFVLA